MRYQIAAPFLRKLLISITSLSLIIGGIVCMLFASKDASKDSSRGEMDQTGDIKITLIILENSEILGYPHAKLVMTNESNQDFCIRYDRAPLQYLNLIVRDAHHGIVSTGYYGAIFSWFGRDRQVCLKPNEVYEHSVDLFETLKKENRIPGQYFIQAIYRYKDSDEVIGRYKGREYKSNTVEVTLRGEKSGKCQERERKKGERKGWKEEETGVGTGSAPRVQRLRLVAAARRTEPEQQTAGDAHLAGPAQGGGGLALARSCARMARLHGKAREKQ